MIRYLKENSIAFDPQTISLLSGVLDDAWRVVEANKTTFRIDGHADDARQALARHIINMARQGNRDRQRLIEGALSRLRL
jgi:hypothetical protein